MLRLKSFKLNFELATPSVHLEGSVENWEAVMANVPVRDNAKLITYEKARMQKPLMHQPAPQPQNAGLQVYGTDVGGARQGAIHGLPQIGWWEHDAAAFGLPVRHSLVQDPMTEQFKPKLRKFGSTQADDRAGATPQPGTTRFATAVRCSHPPPPARASEPRVPRQLQQSPSSASQATSHSSSGTV